MNKIVTMEGAIAGNPLQCDAFSEFTLECGPRNYRVIRIDRQWQIKDLLFLCEGQTLRVTGMLQPEGIVAEKIEILDCSIRTYYKEKAYGNSSIPGTDPGHSEL